MTTISRRSAVQGVIATGATLATPALAAGLTPIRFTLDWKLQGQHSIFFIAAEKGYFREEGLEVRIDQGEGSAATITRVMSGAYDAGFGDINAIIDQAATRPADAPAMVYQFYNRSPFIIATPSVGPIKTLKDLEGHTIGAAVGSAAARLIPVLARLNNLDISKITMTNVQLSLQEQMLVNNQIDAESTYNTTAYINLLQLRKNPDKDYIWFNFGDYGLDLYSNGVMASRRLLRDNPGAVAGIVRAVNRATKEAAANIDGALAILLEVEPLLNVAIERRRFDYCWREVFLSPETKANGFGDVDDARLARGIEIVAEAFQLPRVPKTTEVFDHSFLPPKSDRVVVYKGG